MILILIDLLLMIPLILLGIVPFLKKVFSITTKIICRLLYFTNKRHFQDSHNIKVSKEFKEVVGVKTVKVSRTNLKRKFSINISALVILIICLTLFILNLDFLTGQMVTTHLLKYFTWIPFIKNINDMNTYFTTIVFTLMSFAISNLLKRWKETKPQRKEKRIQKAKKLYLDNTSTKELVDEVNKIEKNNIIE